MDSNVLGMIHLRGLVINFKFDCRDKELERWVDDDDSDSGDDHCWGLAGRDIPLFVIGKTPAYIPRVLVCAPSNSALDEIMYRIMTQ